MFEPETRRDLTLQGSAMEKRSKRFTERTRKLHRLLNILRQLDNRERLTPDSLAQSFDTTKRNIFRDINDLSDAGFAIAFDKSIGTYTFVDTDFTLRDLDLTEDELLALLVGRQMTHGLGEHFEKAFASLLKKARKDTGVKTRGLAKRVEEVHQFWVDLDPMEGFDGIEKQYNGIIDAMDKKRELEIVYESMQKQDETKRQIAPYGMLFSKGMWYVVALCHLREEIRIFALDCIKGLSLTGRYYSIPTDFNLDSYLKPGWRMMRYGDPVEVVLRFSKEVARWIRRRKWHPEQVIEEKKDGSVLFKVRLQGTEEIKRWSYNWAPFCEIISPPELRRKAEEEVKGLAGLYLKKR